MLSYAGLSAALLALGAEAIMIPSTVSLPELSSTASSLKGLSVVDPKSQILKVGCAGCQMAEKDASDRLTWTHGVDNALVLNISVGAQPETLELNGVRFYPPIMSLSLENPVPYIPQVPAETTMQEIRNKAAELKANALRLTSWAFQAGTSQTVSESGEELLTIHLQLNALERQPITVPDIAITTLKNTDGELIILKVETQENVRPVDECNTILCKWRAIFADKLAGFKGMGMGPHFGGKGCGGKGKRPHKEGGMLEHGAPWEQHGGPPSNMHHGPGSHHDGESDKAPEDGHHPHGHGEGAPWRHHGPPGEGGRHHGPPGEHHGRPHHGWHHGHRHHHKWHKALHVVGRVMLTVFVPVLLGVAAGMVTYLVGMFIGAIVAAVYMKVRGRRARYQAVALEEDDDMTPRSSLEKDDFKDEEEGEAPPLYVEKEA